MKPRGSAAKIMVSGITVDQRPLSEKTIKRIEAGLKKFFGKTLSGREIKEITRGLKKRGGRS